jgi:aminopeptidase N
MNRQFWLLVLILSFSVPLWAQDKGYDVKSYSASIHLDRSRDSIWGVVSMRVHSTSALQQIVQHAKYLTIDTVRVGTTGAPLSVRWLDTATGTYAVECNMPAGRDFSVSTQYHGNPRPEQTGGNWGGVTVDDSMMFAMGVGLKAPYTSTTRHWLPCYDLPDDKADTVDLYFWTDSSEVVASNGLSDVMFANHQKVTHWRETWPVATYLLTFAVGPYTIANYTGTNGVARQIFALQRDSIAAANVYSDLIAPSIDYFDSLFVHYPFEKVGYVITPIGSMEHQTMICLDKVAMGDTWDNTTPSHELAHQWWGDWVTCRTFDDAWLNEGFATYCEALVLERFVGRAAYLTRMNSYRSAEVGVTRAKMRIDSLPIYAAATANHHSNNYPPTIYKKAAVVLGMLREYLGDPLFFMWLRTYGGNHAYSTVTTKDLEQTLESMSGQNMGWFFQEFIYDRGAPVVDVRYAPAGTHLSLDITQVQDSLGYRYFRMPLMIQTSKSGTSLPQPIWLDSVKTTHIEITADAPADTLIIDPAHTSLIATRFVSPQAGVDGDASTKLQFNVYPNPASHSVAIEIRSTLPEQWAQIEIVDIRGARLREVALDTTTTTLRKSIDVNQLPAGAYTIIATTRDGRQFSDRLSLK